LDGTLAIYGTAVSIGLLHGVEPGHGWPVAAMLALGKRNRWWYGLWAAVILAVAHLVSSFAVVAVYALANHLFSIHSLGWMSYVAGALLIGMGIRQWVVGHGHTHGPGHSHERSHDREHTHDTDDAGSHAHGHAAPPRDATLLGLVGFAFALGFVHEEEFAIIALAVGKTSPWGLMAAYAGAVALSLILLTAGAIATLNRLEARTHRLEHVLPRVSAVVLVAMGLAYILKLV
jgi:ABC-type nickel/cobalt efflux system permease component RcnA